MPDQPGMPQMPPMEPTGAPPLPPLPQAQAGGAPQMPVGGLLDRFAVGLGGLGAGMQGQPNPVLGQRMQAQQMQQTQQYQQAQMQDAALRRQLELKRLEGDVQQRRLDQARTQLTI